MTVDEATTEYLVAKIIDRLELLQADPAEACRELRGALDKAKGTLEYLHWWERMKAKRTSQVTKK